MNAYYGSDQASLSADELAEWIDVRSATPGDALPYLAAQRKRFVADARTHDPPAHSRHYSISLSPALIPSSGPFISSLVASGVSRYGAYRLLERVAIYSANALHAVPSSKEDVFRDSDMSLHDKHRLMKFLLFAAKDDNDPQEPETPFVQHLARDFALPPALADAVAYAIAQCTSPAGPSSLESNLGC